MADLPQTVGPYEILAKVGEGGMGVVYRARDQRLDRIVALKAVRGDNSGQQELFWKEARAAARVEHPNACRLYDILEVSGQSFLVMELIEGESLAQRLQRGPLSMQEAAQIMLGVLAALEAFHKAGVVHRDLKPENIVLSPDGTKVLDFGVAKQTWQALDSSVAATVAEATTAFVGTPRYASPEQFLGKPVDGRSDLFSCGVIL